MDEQKSRIILKASYSSSRREIRIVAQVIERLLDRERPLLPAYISLNEIRQVFERDPPFWKLSQLMAKLEASFKPLSSFITLKCHNYIYPFIQYHNNSNHHAVINWHLDPSTLSWLSVKQSKLPFPHRDQCQKQYRLLNYLLSQRYTLETVQSILGVGRGSKSTQTQPMNSIMVKLIVSVMNSNTENTRTRLIFWKHLEHIFVTFIFHKLIRFEKMMELLKAELQKTKIPRDNLMKNRDQLMWLILHYISGAVAQRPIDQQLNLKFMSVIDLFTELYPDEEINLPNQEEVGFISAAAPLCIFLQLKKNARRESLGVSMPYSLQNIESLYYQLEKEMTGGRNSFNQIDNRLILMINAHYTGIGATDDQEYSMAPLDHLVNLLSGHGQMQLPGLNCVSSSNHVPMSVQYLDSLTLSGKIHLAIKLNRTIFPPVVNKTTYPSPGIVQTFLRYFNYNEIDNQSIGSLVKRDLPVIINEKKYGQLQIAVDILRYQMTQLPYDKIIGALKPLISAFNNVSATTIYMLEQYQNHIQIPFIQLTNSIRDLCLTFIPQLMTTKQFLNSEDSGSIISDSEELNKSIILGW